MELTKNLDYIKPIECNISKKQLALYERIITEIRKEESAYMGINPYFLGKERS